jgi:GT2 family glycosyltransferase
MSAKKIAIVILNWNGKNFIEKFLPSVIKFSPKDSIYIADNCSEDNSVSFIKSNFPEVSIILNEENGGFAKGYNDALKKVSAEYYILLNSDVEVTENWINPIIEFMDNNPDVAACQPKILSYEDKTRFEYAGASGGYIDKYGYPFCRGRIFNLCEIDYGQYDSISETFWASGACMFVREEVYKKLNGFDEDFFAHMEEIDLCWRIRNTGNKVFVIPQSTVYHVGGGTLHKSNPKKTFLNFRNNLITLFKNDFSSFIYLKIFYRLILDGIAGIVFILKGDYKDCIAVIKAHFAFYSQIKKTNKKRQTLLNNSQKNHKIKTIYQRNIVFQFYFKKCKKFSSLDWNLK